MKNKLNITRVITPSFGVMVMCFCFTSAQHLSAQSADIFETFQGKTQTTASGASVKSPPDVELLKSKPSRFAVGNVELYTAARIADLSMKNRSTDPFGLFQDPDFKPIIKNPGPTAVKRQPSNFAPVPLMDIVNQIKVTTIMIKEKSFLSEGQVFKETGEVSIDFQDRTRRLKILKVEATKIRFKDIDSGEEATRKMDMLPPGVKVGDDKIKPAGMAFPNENQPLKLGN